MSALFHEYPECQFRYLTRVDVIAAAQSVDIVTVVADALVMHAQGRTLLPDEAYLEWTTPDGSAARCLAMPGALLGEGPPVLGLKTINGSLGNPARRIPRSQGFTVLLDPETAQPTALLEAAYISAMRTAAVTAVAARSLGNPEPSTLALLGCGTLAQAHAVLLLEDIPTLRRIVLYDTVPARAPEMARFIADLPNAAGVDVAVVEDPRGCVADADLVVPVTTTTEGYIDHTWLKPGSLVAHVSLDDLLPAAVLRADLVVVDDWGLIQADPRRLLGRMYRSGTLLGPDGQVHPDAPQASRSRRVDTSLGEVLSGRHPGRGHQREVIISNPFGMAILDVAVAHQVLAHATTKDIGSLLTL